MWFLTRLAVMFYVSVILSLGILWLLFVWHRISIVDVTAFLNLVYNDFQSGIIGAVAASLIIFSSFVFARLILGRQSKERTIAFENPAGPVLVSLSALEDLIRRLVVRVPEIKEIRPQIKAVKKGLEVEIRLILKTDVHIPEMTSRLQELVRGKIQDVIGLEEKINVRIYVAKISSEIAKSKKSKDEYDEEPRPQVPFQGYRA